MESLKLVLFGSNNVGKSALLVRLVTGRFISEYSSEEEITNTYVLPRIDNQEHIKLDLTDPTNCVSTDNLMSKSKIQQRDFFLTPMTLIGTGS